MPEQFTWGDEDPTRIDLETDDEEVNWADPLVRRMRGHAIHGNTFFDVPFISQIEENLWQGGCETGLNLPEFIENVVSLYPWERYTLRRDGIIPSYLTVVMYDSTSQGYGQVIEIARWLNAARAQGPTLVHCQAGLNRSSLVAATALVLEGRTGREAVDLIRAQRSPACLCNHAFEDWVVNDLEALL